MCYAVLVRISPGYPTAMGRLHTCYSPVRRSPAKCIATSTAAPRLACVKPVASVHPEPGSNSSLLLFCLFFFFSKKVTITVCIVTKTIPWCLNLWLGGYFLNLNADSKLTENSFRLSLHLGGSFSCTTSSIVNLSMFSLLLFALRYRSEKRCKITSNFWTDKIFYQNFSKNLSF